MEKPDGLNANTFSNCEMIPCNLNYKANVNGRRTTTEAAKTTTTTTTNNNISNNNNNDDDFG